MPKPSHNASKTKQHNTVTDHEISLIHYEMMLSKILYFAPVLFHTLLIQPNYR